MRTKSDEPRIKRRPPHAALVAFLPFVVTPDMSLRGIFWRGIMQLRKWAIVGLTMILGLAGASSASAQSRILERFGNVYAFSVCGRSVPVANARCFAKVVTDARGNIR